MAKMNLSRASKNETQLTATQESENNALSYATAGIQIIKDLSEICASFSSTANSRKTVDAENSTKLMKANAELAKEENRHIEQMAKLELEWKKISNAAEDKAAKRLLIKRTIDSFQEQHDIYLSFDTEQFMTDEVERRLNNLNKIRMELTKELIKAD